MDVTGFDTISRREAPFLAKPPVISGGAVQADPFFPRIG